MGIKAMQMPMVHMAIRLKDMMKDVDRQIVSLTQYLNERYQLSLSYDDVERFEIVEGVVKQASDNSYYLMPEGEDPAKSHWHGYWLYEPSADNIFESRVYFHMGDGHYMKVTIPLG